MCGIAGILSLTGDNKPQVDQINNMIAIMQHRGPDESGIYIDNAIALGHARLSIIDLSKGSQPIANEDKTLWIIYNGEVYNYIDLQRRLERHGHTFRTNTDTEVILHLYEEIGYECVNELNGQFAFAIWNNKTQQLFLARDRLGVRPLHYTIYKNMFFFASEIKSIFSASTIERKLDLHAIDQICTFWTTLPGKTVFKNVFELKPGHFINIKNGSLEEKKYWEYPWYSSEEQLQISPNDISGQIYEQITNSVRLRMRADVPVGAYLSGGIDSSAVTSIIKNKFNPNVHTFGIRFEEESFDEGRYQKEMVSYLNVKNHHEILATNQRIADHFADVIWHSEKPLLRTSPVPLFLLSDYVAQNGIKVVLTGEGADEVFGGYDIFREALIRKFWSRQPQSKIRPLLLSTLYKDIMKNPALQNSLQLFFGQGITDTTNPLYSHVVRWNNTKKLRTLFSNEFSGAIQGYSCIDDLLKQLPENFFSRDTFGKAQYLEISLFMSNYLLSSQGDRVAMAHSIEVRFPFLDHNLIEYMARVPAHWKILGVNEKYILKKAFKGILPELITSRTKHPYRAPISQSFVSNENSLLTEITNEENVTNCSIFDWQIVSLLNKKMKQKISLSETDSMAIAVIYSTQLLWSQFIKDFLIVKKEPANLTVFVDNRT